MLNNCSENRNLLQYQDSCDKYDYLTAVACGAIGGLVDIFFVEIAGDSVLGNWTDAQVDSVVKKFAKALGWSPKETKTDNIASAIGYLEKRFKVNYDQRYSADVAELFKMSTKNHHMKSLSHAPDVLGLFFSVLNQFTSTSTFVSDGQLITIATDTYELQGKILWQRFFVVLPIGSDILCLILQGVPVVRGIVEEEQEWLFLFMSCFSFAHLGSLMWVKINRI